MQVNEIEYQNFKYYYRIYKNDNEELDPIFFISGAFQNMDSWRLISNHFISKTTVVVADLPGMGLADYLPEDYDVDFLVEAVYKILEEVSLENVYMISASYGTILGYKFAKKYPEKISIMVLAGTMKELSQLLKDRIIGSIDIAKKGETQEFAAYVLKNGLMYDGKDADEKINKFKFVKRVLNKQLSAFNKSEMDKYVSNSKRLLNESPIDFIDVPSIKTLIFTGEYDVLTTPESCRNFARKLKNSIFTTIKHADHLFHLEQPTIVIELFTRFGKGDNFDGIENCGEIEFFKASS